MNLSLPNLAGRIKRHGMRSIVLLFLFTVGPFLNVCADGQDGDQLATLIAQVPKTHYKKGERIEVTLVLRSGSRGAYLPDYFGDFMKTCENGFSAVLQTPDGKSASTTMTGCGGSFLHSGPGVDTAETELHHFVHLDAWETRTWHTTLTTEDVMPGRYRVVGEYLSFAYMLEEVSKLPQVDGLMAKGKIRAPLVTVEIR